MFGWLTSKKNNIDPIVEEKMEKGLSNNTQFSKKTLQKLQLNELKQVDEKKLLTILKEYWHFSPDEPIVVWGEIKRVNKSFYRLINVRKLDGNYIEYPISDLDNKESMSSKGIYLPTINTKVKNYYEEGKTYISCHLILDSLSKRKDNPLVVKANPSSIIPIVDIPIVESIKTINNTLLVEESVKKFYITKNIEELNKQLSQDKEKILKNFEEEKQILTEEQEKYSKKITIKQNKLNKEFARLTEINKKNDEKLALFQLSIKNIEGNIQDKKTFLLNLNKEIESLKKRKIKEEKEMSEKLKKLKRFMEEKAKFLRELELIDDEEYYTLVPDTRKATKDIEKFVDFENSFDGDKQQALKHIQAYLFQNDIFYPYYILEDFFALIQTNDLIILAGESGSGKTNLVKEFAEAIGGVAEIIPVKPNWTSPEDLLGYYNPLEKKYLATPFLEALLRAKNNPSVPYLICLDEMNLARVEYYFADFLSLLENRKNDPIIKLYSDDESSHVNSELKMVLSLIESTKKDLKKDHLESYVDILKDKEINQELKRVFGFSDKDSLIKYHSNLKKMLSGILSTPSSIEFPKNVRIIGTVNIDETTNYLSPKILDRAHIMKFDSPLLQDWDKIEREIGVIKDEKLKKIKFKIEDLGERIPYPRYKKGDTFCKEITNMTKKYFSPLGIEVGFRTISQGMNYKNIFIKQGSKEELVLNNFILHKILPKINFDGNKKIGKHTKNDLLLQFKENLKEFIDQDLVKAHGIDAIQELEGIIKSSESNDGIVNYWG